MIPNPNAVQYIRQYREIYTREAITSQLLAAGYPREEIDAAWAAVEADVASDLPPPPADYRRTGGWDAGGSYVQPRRKAIETGPRFWLTMIGFVLLSLLVGALNIVPFGEIFGYNSPLAATGIVVCLVSLLLQIAAVITGLVLWNKNRAVAQGLLFGVFISSVVIPALVFFILLGTCLVILGAYSTA